MVTLENGTKAEKPILFASCSLSPTQQRYSQLHREAMAMIFAVTKLRKYLWGRKFFLVTDHQPIRHIFSPEKSIPIVSSTRLQHWAAILSDFDYRIEHRKSEFLSVADALSRLPLPVQIAEICEPIICDLPISVDTVVKETREDVLLSRVFE